MFQSYFASNSPDTNASGLELCSPNENDWVYMKRPHNTLTPTPESQVGASEHASTSVDDEISLDEVIAKFKATADEDIRAREILAAATCMGASL